MDAHNAEIRQADEQMYLQGLYNCKAFEVVMAHFGAGLSGRPSKAAYFERPIMQETEEEMTQEEIDNQEIQKMILAEEQWIAASKMKGLPETIMAK